MSESRERFIERMQKRSAKLVNQGELSLQEMLNAYELLEQQRDQLLVAAKNAVFEMARVRGQGATFDYAAATLAVFIAKTEQAL